MNISKNTIATQSTICNTKQQLQSVNCIASSNFQLYSPSEYHQKRNYQRAISILNQEIPKKINFSQNIHFYQNSQLMNKKKCKTFPVNASSNEGFQIIKVLQKIFLKKKRYSFQILKQFILFPDETQSSIMSISSYDPLLLKDQIIHSLVKILETRIASNKIWGFINLKMMPYLKAAAKIQEKANIIYEKSIRVKKKQSFNMIKKASQNAFSAIIKQSTPKYLQVQSQILRQNTRIQYFYEENKQTIRKPNNNISSRIIQEQVRPIIRIQNQNTIPVNNSSQTKNSNKSYLQSSYSNYSNEIKNINQSNVRSQNLTTKIYTRQQYQQHLLDLKKCNNQNQQPKYGKQINYRKQREYGKQLQQPTSPRIIKVSANDYQRRIYSPLKSTHINTINQRQIFIQKDIREEVDFKSIKQELGNKKKLELNQDKSQNKINKYNIIHYHQKPRNIVDYSLRQPTKQKQDHSFCCHFPSQSQQYCRFQQKICCECELLSHAAKKNSNAGKSCCFPCQYQKQYIYSPKNSFKVNVHLQNQNNRSYNLTRNDEECSDMINQTTALTNPKNKNKFEIANSSNYQLSQLESRIQYLNFLRKIVQQQQKQQTKL